MRLLAVLTLFLSVNALAQPKLGYVDAYVVFQTHPRVIQANQTIESERQNFVKQLNEKQLYYDQLYNDAEGKIQRDELTEQEQSDLAQKLNKLQSEMQEFIQMAEQKIQERELELLEPVAEELENELQAVAKSRGVDILFQTTNSEGVSMVLDADSKFDFTTAYGKHVKNPNYDNLPDNYYPNVKGVLIGFTNIENLLFMQPKYQTGLQMIEKEKEGYTEQLNYMTEQAYLKLNEYSEGVDKGQFSEEEKTNREYELLKLEQEIKEFGAYQEQQIAMFTDKTINPIIQNLDANIKAVKSEQKLTMVLNQTITQKGSTLLFGDKSMDMTKTIMDRMSVENTMDYEFKPELIQKIGVVEIETVLNSSELFKAKQAEHLEWKEKEVGAINELNIEVQKMLEMLLNGDYEGYDSKEKLEKTYQKKEEELNERKVDLESKSSKKESELMAPVLEKIQAAIDAEAAAGNFQLVVNKNSAGTVWYVREDWEITDEVISRMK